MNKKQKLLSLLQQDKPISSDYLTAVLKSPDSSIRGRISELRKDGYSIISKRIPTKHYILTNTHKRTFIDHLDRYDLYDTYISLSSISNKLNIPLTTLQSIISELFDDYTIIQFTSDQILIRPKERKK